MTENPRFSLAPWAKEADGPVFRARGGLSRVFLEILPDSEYWAFRPGATGGGDTGLLRGFLYWCFGRGQAYEA